MGMEHFDDFDKGKRISIELGTQLQISIGGVSGNFKSTLVGMELEKYLIIVAPVVVSPYGSIKEKFFRGNTITVRYLYRGTVFGFQSQLIEDIFVPLKLIFIKYPKIIAEHNIRSQERIHCFLPVKAKIKSEEKEIDGVLLDISVGGCCCTYKKSNKDKTFSSVEVDEQVSLRLQFPQIEGEQVVFGKAKNIKADKEHMTLGIVFYEILPQLKEIIAQYINAVKELPKDKL
jgi:c-di-GMP-binding flagellar brake protein YcgR